MIDFTNVSIEPFNDDYVNDLNLQGHAKDRRKFLRESFLTDLNMMGTGNLFLNTQTKNLQEVAGIMNFSQAITHRLMTYRGQHPQDFTLGIPWDSYLGQPIYDEEMIKLELAAELTNEVMRDYRTQAVEFISVEFSDINSIEVVMVIRPINLDPTQISFTASRRGG